MAEWVFPFPDAQITGHYGTMSEYRRRNKMQPHSGTDWRARAGTSIPAITSGTVRLIQFSSVLGWVVVQTGWDNLKRKTKYIGYCHLFCDVHKAKCEGPSKGCKSPSARYRVGQKVKAGEKFGIRIGNSGSATTGAHLHATIGSTPKSVFGPTKSKEDLHKFIQRQREGAKAQQTNKKTPKVVLPIKRCPCCKQPLER